MFEGDGDVGECSYKLLSVVYMSSESLMETTASLCSLSEHPSCAEYNWLSWLNIISDQIDKQLFFLSSHSNQLMC